MKSKKISQNNKSRTFSKSNDIHKTYHIQKVGDKNGFLIILLDLLFIIFGIALIIFELLSNQGVLKEMTASLVR